MGLRESIREQIAPLAGDLCVSEVAIGLGYTGVLLENGAAGVAYTFRDLAVGGCGVFNGLRPLAGSRAARLIDMFVSADPIESAVGLACINALTKWLPAQEMPGDVLERLELTPGETVGMVGHFAPLMPGLRSAGVRVIVFERSMDLGSGFLPPEKAVSTLPQCQIALISATTILTGSLEPLLEAASGCREVVLLGASTPLMPRAFDPYGVSMLSGIKVTKGSQVLEVVKEAGGMRQFKGLVEKVNLRSGSGSAS